MSFTFKWPRFSAQFHADAIQMLDSALNKGNKPPVIADRIEVVELEMGSQPPDLEIRDIGELTVDQFRGIFRLTYSGDAHLVLRTKVQANPLNHKQPDIHLITGSRGMLAAKHPLVVPMLLRLSHFKLNSYVVLVVSKQKGITLVFKTDPLQHVDINSTFDSIAVIQKFIQREIEGQLRQMFREDLPGIIHRLSQQWVKAKVEAPYLTKRPMFPPSPLPPPPPLSLDQSAETRSLPGSQSLSLPPHPRSDRSPPSSPFSARRARSLSGLSTASHRSAPTQASPIPPDSQSPSALPDIENFDPTYGLRPEGLPTKSLFGQFRKLFVQNRGLAGLAEEPSEEEEEGEEEEEAEEEDFDYESESFGVLPWDNASRPPNSPSILDNVLEVVETDNTEYETIPAVGGGVITRPRVYHSQSQIQTPPGSSSSRNISSPRRSTSLDHEPFISSSRNSLPLIPGPARSTSRLPTLSNTYHDHTSVTLSDAPNYIDQSTLELTKSLHHQAAFPAINQLSQHFKSNRLSALPTPPLSDSHTEPSTSPGPIRRSLDRRSSISSSIPDGFQLGSPPYFHGTLSSSPDPKIILRPSINNHISKLSTLSHSNHTLSPYTRSLEHFTVRSVPPRAPQRSAGPTSASDRQPCMKAKRKRIYRVGAGTKDRSKLETPEETLPSPPAPPSEFDASDMDRYFRWRDEVVPHFPPDIQPQNMRRRHSFQQKT